jgi:hypothetical protein
MIILIQPVQIINSCGTQFSVPNYTATLGTGGATAAWQILDNSNNILASGTASLSESQYSSWGSNDSYAIGVIASVVGVIPVWPTITSPTTWSIPLNQSARFQIETNSAATKFSATGLPDGLAIDTEAGLIIGTPSAAGTFTSTISAGNSAGTATQTLTITVS